MEKARIIADLEDSLLVDCKHSSTDLHGTLSLGITPEFSSVILPCILPNYTKTFPNVNLHITEGSNLELVEKIRQHKVKLALITSMPLEPSLIFENLQDDPIVLAVPASHPVSRLFDLSVNSPLSPYFLDSGRIKNERFIVCSPELGIGAVTQDMFRRHQINPHIVLTLKRNETALRLAASGIGMTFTPARTPLRIGLSQPMAYFSLDKPIYNRHRGLCYLADEALPKPAQYFIEMLQKAIDSDPAFKNPVCQLIYQPD